MNTQAARDDALALVRGLGWYVFRLVIGHDEAACDGGTASCKTIATARVGGGPRREKWSETSSNDPKLVGSWDWSESNAYGIDCGKSRIFVVDVDPEGEWDGPETRVHLTGRGKHHVYEDLIGLPSGQGVWPHVDTRGVGGMVVGPGSWHPHGAYSMGHDVEPVPVPPEVVARVGRSAPHVPASYTGPAYEDLTPKQQERADWHGEVDLFNWSVRLALAADWPEGHRDDRGRGWELLARDFAWWCSIREAAPYLPPEDGQALFEETMPAAMLANANCRKSVNVLKAADHVPVPPWLDPVFDATPVLRHVRQAAHSRGIPAGPVLLGVLNRVLLCVPPAVTLPPTVGSRASLNLGTVALGSSGATKSTADDVAAEVLGTPAPEGWVLPVGSGEGMVDAFYEWVPSGPRGKLELRLVGDFERHRLFLVDEGETFRKLTERSGTTLAPFLRTALTGGMLGTTNSKAGGHSRRVPARSYRLCFHVNLHPSQAGILLGGENDDTGMPQRFLWVAADGDDLPDDEADLPGWPGSLGWRVPAGLRDGDVAYPPRVARQVRQDRLDASKGKAHPRAAHANLTRLKVAVSLALLHGEVAVTERWWALAGTLTGRSLALQTVVLAGLAESAQAEHDRREIRQGRAQDAAAEDRLQRAVVRVTDKVRAAAGEWVTWRAVKPGPSLRAGLDTADVAAEVGRQTGVEVQEDTGRNGEPAYRFRWVG